MGKGIQTPKAQGRSTQIISMIKLIRTIRLSIKNSISGVRADAPKARVRTAGMLATACIGQDLRSGFKVVATRRGYAPTLDRLSQTPR